MRETLFSENLAKLMKQHDMIKAASRNLFELLENWMIYKEAQQLSELKEQVIYLSKLYDDHFCQEEMVLLPLLKEMYSTNEDVSKYVQEEHSYLHQQFDYLVELISTKQDDPTFDIDHNVSTMLNQQLEHLFVEEQGLFPLIQMYLWSDKK